MPRKTLAGLLHVKTVRRNGLEYLYFNTGQKVNGKPVRISLPFKSDSSFGTAYATAMGNRTRRANAPSRLLVPDLVRLWEGSADFSKRAEGTKRTYGVYLRRLETEFNEAPANGVEPHDIYTLIDKMAATPAAADMILIVARQMFKWAVKRKHVHDDPTAGIDRNDDGGEYEPWPEGLVEEALQDARIRLPVALLYFTAQRIGDVCSMRWTDIRGPALYVTQQKTGKHLEIPVHSRLAEILAETPKAGETILLSPKGRKAKDQTIRSWLKAFGAKRGFDVVPHGLRKNAVNALLEAGCSTGETAAISGQSLRMVEWYAKKRNNPKMGRAAILKWERSGDGKPLGKTDEKGPENVPL